MIGYNQDEEALDGIVSQDGDVFEIGHGYSVRFRIKKVPKSQQRPHGLDYALTMHAPGGRRLVGYDNAHVPEELKLSSRTGRQTQACDHIHYEGRRVKSYDFRTPGDLMEDFWVSVDAKLKEEGSMSEKRILRIGIATRDEMKRRSIAIAKGERKRNPNEPSVWFSSMESLGKVLSARNMLLLDIIRRAEPQSISELANESGRAKSNLSRTLKNLSEIGIVEMVDGSERGRKTRAPRVRYDDFELRGPLGAAA